MRNLLLTIGAIATWTLYWHIGLLAILIYIWAAAMTSTANTAKTRALAAQHAALVSSVATTNQNVTALQNANTGFANALGYGPTSTGSNGSVTSGVVAGAGTDSVGAADNGGVTSGQIGGAAAHYHAMAHGHPYSHYHAETHTHDFGGHAHPVT